MTNAPQGGRRGGLTLAATIFGSATRDGDGPKGVDPITAMVLAARARAPMSTPAQSQAEGRGGLTMAGSLFGSSTREGDGPRKVDAMTAMVLASRSRATTRPVQPVSAEDAREEEQALAFVLRQQRLEGVAGIGLDAALEERAQLSRQQLTNGARYYGPRR